MSAFRFAAMSFALAAFLVGAAGLARSDRTSPIGRDEVPLGLYEVDWPPSDPVTLEKANLGRRFFFDSRLSKGSAMSCATCHNPATGFAERGALSQPVGIVRTRRNSQSILNVGYRATLGWDGKSRTLEDQVRSAFSPWGDMGLDLPEAISAIEKDGPYSKGCRNAFNLSIGPECLVRAIAAFERSQFRGNSRFDRFLFAGDSTALQARELAGWELFKGRAGCITCHDVFHASTNDLGSSYALFSDERFHNLGVGYADGRMTDVGRYAITQDRVDFGAFKTPMLRNVAETSPFMHDGSLATLYDVVTFYNRGGNANPNLSPGIKPLHLTENEKMTLVAFLQALSGEPRPSNQGNRLRR